MKRFLIALLVGGVLFTAAFGAAASLNVTGGTLQMSSAVSAVCQTQTLELGYLFSDADANLLNDNDVVTQAQVRNIDDECVGDVVTVELFTGTSNPADKCDEAEAVIPVDSSGEDKDPTSGKVGVDLDLNDTCNLYNVLYSFVNIASPAVWP